MQTKIITLLFCLSGLTSNGFALDSQIISKIEDSLIEENELAQSGNAARAKKTRASVERQLAKAFPCGRKINLPRNCFFFRKHIDADSLALRCSQGSTDNSEMRTFDKLTFTVSKDKTTKTVFSAFEGIQDSNIDLSSTFEPACFRKKAFFHQGSFIDVNIKLHLLKPAN